MELDICLNCGNNKKMKKMKKGGKKNEKVGFKIHCRI